MKTLTIPVTLDTTYGPLYIAVSPARRHSYHDMKRGNVTDLRPMLRVAADPEFTGDASAAEHWTIRRRAYGVHWRIFFEDRTRIEYADGRRGERWHRERPYDGGFRTDHGGSVEFGAKTWALMWAAVTAALDAFDAAHPGWGDLSRYLMHVADRDQAQSEADTAHQVYLGRMAAVREHEQQVSDTLYSLPDYLAAMIITKSED